MTVHKFELWQRFAYDPLNRQMIWRGSRYHSKNGTVAGHINKCGYHEIKIVVNDRVKTMSLRYAIETWLS